MYMCMCGKHDDVHVLMIEESQPYPDFSWGESDWKKFYLFCVLPLAYPWIHYLLHVCVYQTPQWSAANMFQRYMYSLYHLANKTFYYHSVMIWISSLVN